MTDRPTIEQLHNLVDRAQHGLTASEVARLREGITDLARAEAELQQHTDIETTARVFAALHHGAEETVTRVIGLYEQWVKAGVPLGVSIGRWWDRRLAELHTAIHAPAEQPARTTAKNPAATEATDTWKEPMHPHPCTATIEGRATPGRRRVQCTREARHPENHVGPKLGSDGRVLWTDHQAGAIPHKEQP